jgi:hypothetical protein
MADKPDALSKEFSYYICYFATEYYVGGSFIQYVSLLFFLWGHGWMIQLHTGIEGWDFKENICNIWAITLYFYP